MEIFTIFNSGWCYLDVNTITTQLSVPFLFHWMLSLPRWLLQKKNSQELALYTQEGIGNGPLFERYKKCGDAWKFND